MNLADGRDVRLPRPPVLAARHQRDRAVPARRAAHRASSRPLTADPHRHPRALHRGRQEHDVVDDHVVAVEAHRLARPEQGEGRQALVQARGDLPRIGALAERAELVRQRSAQAHPQDHPAAGEPVQGRHLPGQLRHPPPRDRRDHRAQPDRPRRERGGGQQHPRIGDLPAPRFRVGDVIPDEQAVPARVLGEPGQVGDDAGVGEVAEVRHVDGEVHVLATRGRCDQACGETSSQVRHCWRPWHTTRVATLKLPSLPFPLEPAGSPPPGCRILHGALILTAAAGTDLFVDPAGPGDAAPLPDAGRLVGLPPAGDFTLAARVSVDFASVYDAGVLLVHAAERQWAKLCFEYSPQQRPTLVTVVTRGTSDDCNSDEVERRHRMAPDHAVRGGVGLPRLRGRDLVAAAPLFRAGASPGWSGSASWPSPPPARAAPPPSTRSPSAPAPRRTSATAADPVTTRGRSWPGQWRAAIA